MPANDTGSGRWGTTAVSAVRQIRPLKRIDVLAAERGGAGRPAPRQSIRAKRLVSGTAPSAVGLSGGYQVAGED
jgi:hypothetical protein